MNFFKLTLSYQGTAYKGWQKQPDAPTVQGELEKALTRILKADFRTIGSGRTDAGVHALAQVVKLEAKASIQPTALLKGLNSLLPRDIRALEVEKTDVDFHPIFQAHSKEYWYLFSCGSELSAFEAPFITKVKGDLDIQKLHEACRLFVGRHNFSHYFCLGTEVQSYVREIYECKIDFVEKTGPWGQIFLSGPYYTLKIRGNGFLKQMVRLVAGTIFKYGKAQLTREDIESSLRDEGRSHLAAVAPPQGLYLAKVFYDK